MCRRQYVIDERSRAHADAVACGRHVTGNHDESHRAAKRDRAGRRLPHRARAGRRRLRRHLSRRRDRARPRSSPSRNISRATSPRATGGIDAAPRSQDCAGDYRWGLDRFIEEAQTLAKFNHTNIVRVYRYFRANNTGYMVLHFEEGQSLKAWLKGLGRAPRQKELDAIVAPLLDALETDPQGRLPASRHRARQHHHPQVGRSGADRFRLGARRDRLAHQDRLGAGEAGLQPLRAVRRDEPPAGPVDRHLRARRHALSRGHRQAAARCALAHGQGRDRPGARSGARLLSRRASSRRSTRRWRSTSKRGRSRSPPGAAICWRPIRRAPAGSRARDARRRSRKPEVAAPNAVTERVVGAADRCCRRPTCPGPRAACSISSTGCARSPPAEPRRARRAPAKPPPEPAKAEAPAPAKNEAEAPSRRSRQSSSRSRGARADPQGPRPRRGQAPRAAAAPREGQPAQPGCPSRSSCSSASASPAPPSPCRTASRASKAAARPCTSSQTQSLQTPQRPARCHAHRRDRGASRRRHRHGLQRRRPLDRHHRRGRHAEGLGRRLPHADPHHRARRRARRPSLALNGTRALTGHANGKVVLWDLERAEKVATVQRNEANIWAVAFTGDRRPLRHREPRLEGDAVGCATSRRRRCTCSTATRTRCRRSPIRRSTLLLASGSADKTVRLWDLRDARPQAHLQRPARLRDRASPSRTTARLLAAGALDGRIHVWSVGPSRRLRSLSGHKGRVADVAFSPSGDLLASAGEDGTVRLWDLRRGRILRALTGHRGGATAVAFAPDGQHLASAGANGVMRFWAAPLAQLATRIARRRANRCCSFSVQL